MRYVPGVTPKHRLLFGDRILEIESTLNLEERSRLLELLCKERLNGQSG
jgi:head-tail adaptor